MYGSKTDFKISSTRFVRVDHVRIIIEVCCLNPCENLEKDKIVLDTVRRFKGLDSPVVILRVTSDLLREDELLYVAISRARTKLYVISDESSLKKREECDKKL